MEEIGGDGIEIPIRKQRKRKHQQNESAISRK